MLLANSFFSMPIKTGDLSPTNDDQILDMIGENGLTPLDIAAYDQAQKELLDLYQETQQKEDEAVDVAQAQSQISIKEDDLATESDGSAIYDDVLEETNIKFLTKVPSYRKMRKMILNHFQKILSEKWRGGFYQLSWNDIRATDIIGWPEDIPQEDVELLNRKSLFKIWQNRHKIALSDESLERFYPLKARQEIEEKRNMLYNAMLTTFKRKTGSNHHIPWNAFLQKGMISKGWPKSVPLRAIDLINENQIRTLLYHLKNIEFSPKLKNYGQTNGLQP